MEVLIIEIKLDNYAYPPVRAHDTDAGLDIRAERSEILNPQKSAIFNTGVHVQLPHNTAGVLMSKSGLNVKSGIVSTGLIDEGYTGEIVVKLYNLGENPVEIKAGDKITQLVVIPVLYEDIKIVDEMKSSERGDNGFGSSGR